ncbi:hypothetical protein [Vibrio sp. 99-70-13A1]|uniref:hypothetical protein n=1 Tax=Vibrio sp. 99-70-13A1 TaxID=2607601 RepID=UPI001493632E|nr:hypothetical protein [Vibrio sp. 99-70-13A1]NOH97223.1 hypothetical protein [Vibrio sp. 99-70-13A1]
MFVKVKTDIEASRIINNLRLFYTSYSSPSIHQSLKRSSLAFSSTGGVYADDLETLYLVCIDRLWLSTHSSISKNAATYIVFKLVSSGYVEAKYKIFGSNVIQVSPLVSLNCENIAIDTAILKHKCGDFGAVDMIRMKLNFAGVLNNGTVESVHKIGGQKISIVTDQVGTEREQTRVNIQTEVTRLNSII